MSQVNPSGADFATASLPILPPAPGRFSTTTEIPQRLVSSPAIKRAIESDAPAAV
jgi:hypothetical protein